MTTVTLTLTNICTGGNHLEFELIGAAARTQPMTVAELSDAITKEDLKGFINCIVKMAKNGRTNGQAKTLLQAGVTVTV